jgi:site-specific DNA recombinase
MIFLKLRACLQGKRQFLEKNDADAPLSAQQRREEAERVRMIFRRYPEVSGINELVRGLGAKNICTKARTFGNGKTRGGIPFGRGALSYFLRNRFFIGEVKYRGEILPGEQPAIIDKALFEAVQQKLSAHQSHKTLNRQKSDHLLRDLLFDDVGHRMIATHATKAGVRYRYYVSQPGLHGEARTATLGSVSRVPAPEIEQAIVSALRKHLTDDHPGEKSMPSKSGLIAPRWLH